MAKLKGGTLQQLAQDQGTNEEELKKLNPNLRADTTYTVGEVKFPTFTQPKGTSQDITGYTRKGDDVYDPQGNYVSFDEAQKRGIVPLLAGIPQQEIKPELPIDTDITGGGAVTDTGKQRAEQKSQLDQIQGLASSLGVQSPTTQVNDTAQQILSSLQARQKEMDKRQAEDLTAIETQYGTAVEQLTETQRLEKEKAEGRVYYKGYVFKSEVDELTRLDQSHRIEANNLLQAKTSAIQQAQRFYADQDYQNAQQQLEFAQNIEKQENQAKQQYFDNVTKAYDFYQKIQKPLKDAEQADIDQALGMLEQAPSIIQTLGIKPSDLYFGGASTSLGSITAAFLDSPEYEQQQAMDLAQLRNQQRLATGSSAGGVGSSVENWANLLSTGQATISNVPTNIRNSVVSYLGSQGIDINKPLSDTALTHINQTQFALTSLNDLRSIIQSNLEFIGPVSGLQRLNPWSKARRVQADVDRVRQTVGKALEGGVLRKEDEDKYKKILATLNDTPETALYKIDALASSITRDIENYKTLQSESGRFVPGVGKFKVEAPKVEDLRTKYNY